MNKKVLIAVLGIAIVVGGAFVLTPASPVTPSTNPFMEQFSENGRICIQKIDGLTSKVTDYGCSHNLLTNIGSEYYAQATNGTSSNYAWTNMTLGGNTSALAATDTDLANIYSANGLAPAAGTITTVAQGNTSLNYQWTSSGASTYNVNTTGIYNTTGAGAHLIAEAYFGSNVALNGANGDKLNVTYYRKVS